MENKYKKLLYEAIKQKNYRHDRTGVGSYSIFCKNISFSIKNKFPILTGRKISQKIFETEFKWFLNGETNIKRFKENNIKIWDNWANKNGDLGPVYGYQMINYNGTKINQLNNLLHSLKTNPYSRRHIISLWNPNQINDMALPPCYHTFQFYILNGTLNLSIIQRSGDLFLGIPYDICFFSLFLLYVSEKCNLKANIIDLKIIDAHIYKNQLIAINDYLNQPNFNLPKYTYKNSNLQLKNYLYSKIITAPISI